jgi:flavin-dependent dehydrogenase
VTTHDVVIIGGSLAGASCARELERQGIDAIALERDRFPRRKVCGGFLSPGAVECVRHLGLLDSLRKAGAVEVRSARVRSENVEVDFPFERPGLGISRNALDDIFASRARVCQGHLVREVRRPDRGFIVDGIGCSVVIDASGKLGRFTRRQRVDEFGIQYTEPQPRGSVLDFWFFEEGYGGGVSIEGGQSNFCFLVRKEALPRYLGRPECLVTGPLAYVRLPGEFIAIGDAAGMVDPFCGEGMRHAMETGILAARVVAAGIRHRANYDEMKWQYESQWERKWMLRRALSAGMRRMLRHRMWPASAMHFAPRVLKLLWT